MRCRQSKAEAAISDEVMTFQHEFVGRGPGDHSQEAHRSEVVSVHSDISTKSGEWMDVFVLGHSIEEG